MRLRHTSKHNKQLAALAFFAFATAGPYKQHVCALPLSQCPRAIATALGCQRNACLLVVRVAHFATTKIWFLRFYKSKKLRLFRNAKTKSDLQLRQLLQKDFWALAQKRFCKFDFWTLQKFASCKKSCATFAQRTPSPQGLRVMIACNHVLFCASQNQEQNVSHILVTLSFGTQVTPLVSKTYQF